MAQRIHPASEADGRLARTRLETAQLNARHRVDVQRRAAFRDARERHGSLLELVDQLGASSQDPSEIVFLQERAREEAATVVCLLGGKGAAVLQPRPTSLELQQAVELLDDVLRLAEDRLTGSAHVALELALIVRAGIEGLAHAQPVIRHQLDPVALPPLVGDPSRPEYRFAWWCHSCGVYRAVDDREHCAECVPPWSELLPQLVEVHLRAALAVPVSAPVTDPERRWHLDVARDALALIGRPVAPVLVEDDALGEGRGDG